MGDCDMRLLVLLFLGILHWSPLSGQWSLMVEWKDEAGNPPLKNLKFKTKLPDSISVLNEIKAIIEQLIENSYLESSIDEVLWAQKKCTVGIHHGASYYWKDMCTGNVEEGLLESAGFRPSGFIKKPVSAQKTSRLMQAILQQLGNSGYPFATLTMDTLAVVGNELSGCLHVQKNALVFVEQIKATEENVIRPEYLHRFLGLSPGQPYQMDKIITARERLRQTQFLICKEEPTVRFIGDKASILLPLEKKNANRFDFLIGILPSSSTLVGGGRRVQITGSFKGELYNQFLRGERIFVSFEQLRPQTQRLNLQANYPYLFKTAFGATALFDLYRRDSAYIDIEYDLGIQYLRETGDAFKIFWNRRRSNLLEPPQTASPAFNYPQNIDFKKSTFGLHYSRQKLDYRFNPRKGWQMKLEMGAGRKQIIKNQRSEVLTLYDSLPAKSFEWRGNALLEKYWPMFKRNTLKAAIRSAWLFSKDPIFANEQYRLGGNQLMRGFDEDFFFATHFAVGTLEYRLLLDENSFLYIFGDWAYIDDNTINKQFSAAYYGFGAGITFETRAGIFAVGTAIGNRAGIAPDFSAPKVHFGYLSLF